MARLWLVKWGRLRGSQLHRLRRNKLENLSPEPINAYFTNHQAGRCMCPCFGSSKFAIPAKSGVDMNDDVQTQPPTARCPCCRGTMKLVRHLTLEALPDIYIYYCKACRHVENIKQERAA
jgi:hypothetical protein